MALKQLLEQLCSEFDIKCPKIDPEKGAMIALNSNFSILLQDLSPGFSMHSNIAPPSQKKCEDLYIYLMRANFLGQGTGGARIGMDAEEKFLTLSLGFSYDMDYRNFKETIEDFVNFVAYWRDEAAKFEDR